MWLLRQPFYLLVSVYIEESEEKFLSQGRPKRITPTQKLIAFCFEREIWLSVVLLSYLSKSCLHQPKQKAYSKSDVQFHELHGALERSTGQLLWSPKQFLRRTTHPAWAKRHKNSKVEPKRVWWKLVKRTTITIKRLSPVFDLYFSCKHRTRSKFLQTVFCEYL